MTKTLPQTVNAATLSVTPRMIREWLASRNWALTREKPGVAELWTAANSAGRRREAPPQVLLPLRTDFEDYETRLELALDKLTRLYGLSIRELSDEMFSTRSDLFFVRLDQDSQDGTIPLVQATAALTSISKMIRAAATSAADPSHSHLGRRPARVKEFVDSDLRLGHTKQGSFIITVAARLDDDSESAVDQESSAVDEAEVPGDTPVANEGNASVSTAHMPKPFSRQVMETLATALLLTKKSVEDGDKGSVDIDSAMRQGMSLELVQSLLEVTEAEGLKKVDLSFDWAAAGPPAPEVGEIEIRSADLEGLASVRDRLIRKEKPVEQTLVGRVAELGREEIAGVEQHSITLEAEFGGRMRRIRVPLNPKQYDWAIFAHQRRLPFTVTGIPVRHQRWFLEGVVDADVSFLEMVRGREQAAGTAPPPEAG